MLDMTTSQPHHARVHHIRPTPAPLLLLPEWRVRVVAGATVRAGRLRALVLVQRNHAPAYADEGFRVRVEGLVARHRTAHALAHQT